MDAVGNWYTQAFPPAPTFTEADVPSQEGRVFIVTGGNAGVGYELCKMLYATCATVYMASRSQAKAQRAIQTITASTSPSSAGGGLHFLPLDLSDLTSVRAAAADFQARESRLDVLWHNAGLGGKSVPAGARTAQGIEMYAGTHCVAPLLLTTLLLPPLRFAAAQDGARAGKTRVVWTSSWLAEGTSPAGGVDMAKLTNGHGDSTANYAVSKAGNWILAAELGRRYGKDGVLSVVQNPGNLRTEAYAGLGGLARRLLGWTMLHEPRLGACTELFAGLSAELDMERQGAYIMPWGRVQDRSPREDIAKAIEGGLGKEFWGWCERQWEG